MAKKNEPTKDARECSSCKKAYEMYEARRKMLACCGQRLTRTEVIMKSSPEPFGP
jgi:hypothetical protein